MADSPFTADRKKQAREDLIVALTNLKESLKTADHSVKAQECSDFCGWLASQPHLLASSSELSNVVNELRIICACGGELFR